MKRSIAAIPVLALTFVAACADDSKDVEERITYFDDALPVFAEHCNACHTEGAVAPFAIDEYESADQWKQAIAAAVESRTMPPYGVNADGNCNEFDEPRWLSEDEIDTISAWVEAGGEEGELEGPMPVPPQLDTLRGVGPKEVATPAGYVPVPQTYAGGEFDDYQCFLIELDHTEDQFLVGFDVQPGNDATVHHVLGFEVSPNGANGELMAELDAVSPDQPGWDCFAAAGDGVLIEGVPITWAPGVGATNFPDGTGIRFETGKVLVIQVHYNLVNDNGPDQTKVVLDFADSVEREAQQTVFDPFLFTSFSPEPARLEPGRESVTYNWEVPIADTIFETGNREVDVYGLLPHMHSRGRTMQIDFMVDGQRQCGADVDRYDYNWQRTYFFKEPMRMRLQDTVNVTCDWNTLGDTEPVFPGFGTADEMCLIGMYIVET